MQGLKATRNFFKMLWLRVHAPCAYWQARGDKLMSGYNCWMVSRKPTRLKTGSINRPGKAVSYAYPPVQAPKGRIPFIGYSLAAAHRRAVLHAEYMNKLMFKRKRK